MLPLPVRELMALNPKLSCHPEQREGRPSFWERPSHALPDRKDSRPRGEPHPSPPTVPDGEKHHIEFERRLADFSRHARRRAGRRPGRVVRQIERCSVFLHHLLELLARHFIGRPQQALGDALNFGSMLV
jgi:hypothetical protein